MIYILSYCIIAICAMGHFVWEHKGVKVRELPLLLLFGSLWPITVPTHILILIGDKYGDIVLFNRK